MFSENKKHKYGNGERFECYIMCALTGLPRPGKFLTKSWKVVLFSRSGIVMQFVKR